MTSVSSAACRTSHLGLPHFCGTDSVGHSGGLLLRWDDSVVLSSFSFNPHFILCTVSLGANLACGSNVIRGQRDFTSWRLDNSLLDVPFFGPPFTWFNNRSDDQLIMERLDRAYANNEWPHLFSAASIMHLPILISDHSPIILKFLPTSKSCRRPYRLDNWCFSSPKIANIVDCARRISIPGSPMYVLSCRLASLSSADCLLLSAPFTALDIIHALNDMDGSKSPGPDGITPKFFQTFWPQVGNLVTLALLRFLNSGVMLKECNNTHIILIPKVDKPELVFQYRPISLCNVIYRLAYKCLANRLKLVISSIVSDSKQAFIPSRLMSDGCLITHEIMHYLNKTKKGSVSYAALKLDMHKAFDRVSWPFLIAIMKKFGFPVFWQNIIWECISTVTYNILINGEPSSSFRPSCGLSPNAPGDFKSHMASILKMRTSDSFGYYLGVPVDLPSKKYLVFQPLLDKMTTRIIAWSSLHLSQPCKLLIINSIILGSIRFWMASVLFPIGICKKLDSLIAAFWWRKDVRHRSIHWLSRDSLQLPRADGGLGLKSVSMLSQASLMKNFWRIHHQPSGLLAKFMLPKYRKDLPIPDLRSKVSHPSFLWSGLCCTANAFAPGFSWKLGNGSSVDLLTSPWVNGNSPLVRPVPADASPVFSSLLTPSGDWNQVAVHRWFQSPCAKIILAMEPPHTDIDDFLYWKYTEDRVYTARSVMISCFHAYPFPVLLLFIPLFGGKCFGVFDALLSFLFLFGV
ncbi:uncharacterized protein LOC141594783 [Silene latifolia]|uniref:uncharacterized protein LOC141594783 n=1 Tax=Silene latifolia TaxID=37657 RepID=UPI003D77F26F